MEQMQIIAILFSLTLLGYILWIIRSRKLKEEYSLLWLITGVVFLVFSAWRNGLEMLADIIGIAYPPAALFMLILIGVLLILIQFSMIISSLSERSKVIAQEHAILKAELAQLKQEMVTNTPPQKDEDTDRPSDLPEN